MKKDRRMEQFKIDLREGAKVDKVYGIVSGKGGVGKSLVTSLLANETALRGLNTAIFDADITGPSIPKCYGIDTKAGVEGDLMIPVKSANGIQVMSINLILEDVTQPVIFRGPVIANTVRQFWTNVFWNDVDIMFVDMPPGTGDVPLTVFQSLPLDGIIVVASPQDLVNMVVEKAINMANVMRIPIIALVENMSYFECRDCGKKHKIYGDSHLKEIAAKHKPTKDAPIVEIPILPELAALCDAGKVYDYKNHYFDSIMDAIVN
ncbi:MAG: Mrp/NBP35 family ATP-binding protein [Lachnospiraceae bacterium]|nr:Mrp/NBP35 family ATP-binding protein [Lachnospiraceae bacterium]